MQESIVLLTFLLSLCSILSYSNVMSDICSQNQILLATEMLPHVQPHMTSWMCHQCRQYKKGVIKAPTERLNESYKT